MGQLKISLSTIAKSLAILTLALAMVSSVSAEKKTSYYFNEGSSPLIDHINGFNGSWQGTPDTSVSGVDSSLGSGLSSNGEWHDGEAYDWGENSWANIGTPSEISNTELGSTVSAAGWVKIRDLDGGQVCGLKYGSAGGNDAFHVGKYQSNDKDGDGTSGGFTVYVDGGDGGTWAQVESISTNQWYFLAGMYNGSTIKLVVKEPGGMTYEDTTSYSGGGLSSVGSSGVWSIGARKDGSGGQNYCNGLSDEWKLFNHTLVDSEINTLFEYNILNSNTGSNPPSISTPSPLNGENKVSNTTNLSVDITDSDNSSLDSVAFYWSNDTLIESKSSISTGTVSTSGLSLDSGNSYTWYVNVSDGVNTIQSQKYSFSTKIKSLQDPFFDFTMDDSCPIKDSSNNNFYGICNGNPNTQITGQVNNATDFDEVGDWVNISKPFDVSALGNSYSAVAWQQPDSLPTDGSNDEYIFVAGSNSGNDAFGILNRGSDRGMGCYTDPSGNDGGFLTYDYSNNWLSDDNWYFVACRWNGSQLTLTVYEKDWTKHEKSISMTGPELSSIGSGEYSIGGRSPGEKLMDGKIDEFKLYNSSLSDSTIKSIAGFQDLPVPKFFNLEQNKSTITPGENAVELSAKIENYSYSFLESNETGIPVNTTLNTLFQDRKGGPIYSATDTGFGNDNLMGNPGIMTYPNGTIATYNGSYWMFFGDTKSNGKQCAGLVRSDDINFTNPTFVGQNPVLCGDDQNAESWESGGTRNPELVYMKNDNGSLIDSDNPIHMYYIGNNGAGGKGLGVAYSDDMKTFTRNTSANPIGGFTVESGSDGVEDFTLRRGDDEVWKATYEEDGGSDNNIRLAENSDRIPFSDWTAIGYAGGSNDNLVSHCQKTTNPTLLRYETVNGNEYWNVAYECQKDSDRNNDNTGLAMWNNEFKTTGWTQEGLNIDTDKSWEGTSVIPNGGGQIGSKVLVFYGGGTGNEGVNHSYAVGDSFHWSSLGSIFDSPKKSQVNSGVKNQNNFTFNNYNLRGGRTVEWKIWANNSESEYNSSRSLTFDIESQSTDTTASSISIYFPQNQEYSSSSVDLNVTSENIIDTWEYSLDGGSNQTFTPNTTITGLSDGSHTIDVYATDTDGNTGSQTVTFTVELSPPTSSDNWTETGFVDLSSVTVELSASDSDGSVSNISYRVNGGSYTTVQGSTATVTVDTVGNNTLEYYATDTDGNQESVNTEYVALGDAAIISGAFQTRDTVTYGDTINYTSSIKDPHQSVEEVNISIQYQNGTYIVENQTLTSASDKLLYERTGGNTLSTAVPRSSFYDVKLVGAGGGNGDILSYGSQPAYTTTTSGGKGGYVTATFEANQGQQLDLWSAEAGSDGDTSFTENELTSGGTGYRNGGSGGNCYDDAGTVFDPSGLRAEAGGGGGSSRIALDGNLVAAADGGGGGAAAGYDTGSSSTQRECASAGGGGARGGAGGSIIGDTTGDSGQTKFGFAGDGTGDGGNGGNASSVYDSLANTFANPGEDGDAEVNTSIIYNPQAYNPVKGGGNSGDGIAQIHRTGRYVANQLHTVKKAGVHYNITVRAKDDTGLTSKKQSSYYVNKTPPEITQSNITVDQVNDIQKIVFNTFDQKPGNIDSFTGTGSTNVFDNSTLDLSITLPLVDTYTVTNFWSKQASKSIDLVNETGKIKEDNDFDNNLSNQRLERRYYLENNGNDVNYSITLDGQGTPVQGPTWNGELLNGNSINKTAVWKDDYLNNTNYDLRPNPSKVTLGIDYAGRLPMHINNTAPVEWTNIETTPHLSIPNKCSQINNTVVNISKNFNRNLSIGFTCNPGTKGNPGILKTLDATPNNQTRYNYTTTDMEIYSPVTEQTPVVWKINKDELNDWDKRNNMSASIDGRTTNVSIEETLDFVYVTFGTDCCSSSPAPGTHTASVTYYVGEENTTTVSDGSSGGSGGGGGSIEDDETEEYDITFDTSNIYPAQSGTTTRRTLRINNLLAKEVTVDITELTDQYPGCRYIDIQQLRNDPNTFGDSASYTLPSRTQGLTQSSFTDQISFRTALPPMQQLNGTTINGTVTCGYKVESSAGRARDIKLTVKPQQGVLASLNEAFRRAFGQPLYRFDTVCTALTVLQTGQESCPKSQSTTIPVPSAAGGASILIIVGLGLAVYRRTST